MILRKSRMRFPQKFQKWLRTSTASRSELDRPSPVHLAPGNGFTFELAGESRYQADLDAICGGKCDQGHKLSCIAQLCFEEGNPDDSNAIAVLINGRVVGYIPQTLAAGLRSQILALNPGQRPVTCDAMIVGGWRRGPDEEGQYGVKLSLSAPLKVEARGTWGSSTNDHSSSISGRGL